MSIFTPPNVRPTDEDNVLLPGAKWRFCLTRTTTPASIYTTSDLDVAHTNPVEAVGGHFPPIFLDPAIVYRATLLTAAGAIVPGFDFDPYNPARAAAGIDLEDGGSVQDFVDSVDPLFGAAPGLTDPSATLVVQDAIDALPEEGGTIPVPEGVKFNLKSLTGLVRVALSYRIDDDLSTGLPGSGRGSGERVYFLATSDYDVDDNPNGGAVNEWRFTAAYHPGLCADVRKDVPGADIGLGPLQDRNPARASIFISDEQLPMFAFRYRSLDGDTYDALTSGYIQTLRHTILLTITGVAASAFGLALSIKDKVVGNMSGAWGYLRADPATDGLTLQWGGGQFVTGETLNHPATGNNSAPITVPDNSYSESENVGLWFDLWNGAVSCGEQGAGNAVEMWNVHGNTLTVPSASSSLNRINTRTKPFHWFAASLASAATSKVGIGIDPTIGADGQRRLKVYNHNEANTGALIPVAAKFHMSGSASPVYSLSGGDASYNTTSATKNATGKYTVVFASNTISANYAVVATMDVGHSMGGWTYGVTAAGVGGFEIWFYDASGALTDLPANSVVQVIAIGGDM
jgi:hypothetical protein